MPWVEGDNNPGGLKGRERFPAALQAARDGGDAPFPRASACGLSPGLCSPGPSGRPECIRSVERGARRCVRGRHLAGERQRPASRPARGHSRLAWTGRGGHGVKAFRTHLETALAHLGVELAYQGERTCKLGEAFAHQGELPAHQGEVFAHQGEVFAHQGEVPAHQGELLAHQGELLAYQGELLALMGERTPRRGELHLGLGVLAKRLATSSAPDNGGSLRLASGPESLGGRLLLDVGDHGGPVNSIVE